MGTVSPLAVGEGEDRGEIDNEVGVIRREITSAHQVPRPTPKRRAATGFCGRCRAHAAPPPQAVLKRVVSDEEARDLQDPASAKVAKLKYPKGKVGKVGKKVKAAMAKHRAGAIKELKSRFA